MFNILDFLEDNSIPYASEGKNISTNGSWIGLNCPRCGDHGNHLGANLDTSVFTCWKCGYLPLLEAIRGFLGVDWSTAKRIAYKYGTEKVQVRYKGTEREKNIDVQLPDECLDYLPKRYTEYLESRNFDPEYIQRTFDIKCTKKIGRYKNRIIAPVYFRNRLMSYVGRDITGSSDLRYKACNSEEERRSIKSCLYALDLTLGRSVVVLEGITDVWRFGPGSVATFGIKYTSAQVLLLCQFFDRIFVLFDPEDFAQEASMKLVQQINTMGKYGESVKLNSTKDPAELSQKEAGFIMRELLI